MSLIQPVYRDPRQAVSRSPALQAQIDAVNQAHWDEVRRIGQIPVEKRTPAELGILKPSDGPSKKFKIARAVGLGFIGAVTAGAALTAAGVIGGASAAAAPVAASATPGGIGLTAAAGLPAYAPQIASAQAVAAGAGAVAPAGGFALGIKTAAGVVASVGSAAGSVASLKKSAGMTAEAGAPAYAAQLAAARQPTTRSTIAAPAAQNPALIAAGLLLLFFVLK